MRVWRQLVAPHGIYHHAAFRMAFADTARAGLDRGTIMPIALVARVHWHLMFSDHVVQFYNPFN